MLLMGTCCFALSVSGLRCSIAGAVFAIGKNKKNENKNAKVEVIA